MLHALHHLAPDRVLAVEEAAIVEADEELAVGAVGIGGAGHRGGTADMGLAAELGGQIGLARAAGAGPGRVAALGHKPIDHAMEDNPVVKALLDQLLDPIDMAGRQIGPKPDHHIAAAVEAQNQGVGIVGHVRLPGCGCFGRP